MNRYLMIFLLAASLTNLAMAIWNGRKRSELGRLIASNRGLEARNKEMALRLDAREKDLNRRETTKTLEGIEYELHDLHEARKHGAVKTRVPRRTAYVISGTREVTTGDLHISCCEDLHIGIEEYITVQAVLDGELINVTELNYGRKRKERHNEQ